MDDMHKEGTVPSVCAVVVGKGRCWDAVMLRFLVTEEWIL
jgi:hypothetical protein